jgi:excisionase family DNA binding protein
LPTEFSSINFYALSIPINRRRKSMKTTHQEQQYLSTRQSAKMLQVSLGTVQKMVEEGDLIAWKTRGGHRRILATSLNQQLRRRKLGLQERASKQRHLALGIFRRPENLAQMRDMMGSWSLKLDIIGSLDSLEGLMQAVSPLSRHHLPRLFHTAH